MVEPSRRYLELVRNLPDALRPGGDVEQGMGPLLEACRSLREAYGPATASVVERARPVAASVLARAPTATRRLVGHWLAVRAYELTARRVAEETWVELRTRGPSALLDGCAFLEASENGLLPEDAATAARLLVPLSHSDRPDRRSVADLVVRLRSLMDAPDDALLLLTLLDSDSSEDERTWRGVVDRLRVTRVRCDAVAAWARAVAGAGRWEEAARSLLRELTAEAWTPVTLYNATLYAALSRRTDCQSTARRVVEARSFPRLLPSAECLDQTRRDAALWREAWRDRSSAAFLLEVLPPAMIDIVHSTREGT